MQARSVGEAWQLVHESPVAAAFVDLHLPGVYGWELVRRMRQDARLRNVPILIVSADLGEAEKLEAEQLGCGYLPKPFDLEQFLERARAMIAEGRGAGRDEVRVMLLLDAYEIEGTIRVNARSGEFSEAWEGVMANSRAYLPVRNARIKTIATDRTIDSPGEIHVKKADLRAVSPLDELPGD